MGIQISVGGIDTGELAEILEDGSLSDLLDGLNLETDGSIKIGDSNGRLEIDRENQLLTLGYTDGKVEIDLSTGEVTVNSGGTVFEFKTGDGGEISTDTDTLFTLGDSEAGVIVHSSSGTTQEGVSVSATNWVEVFGEEIHFSEV